MPLLVRYMLRCWRMTVPILVILSLSLALGLHRQWTFAQLLSVFGTVFVLGWNVFFIVFVDPHKKFGRTSSWTNRLVKLLSYGRRG
jgi:hypothetical protein